MAEVDTGDVEALTEGDVETVVPIVTVLAKSYTRGQGLVAGRADGVEPLPQAGDVALGVTTVSQLNRNSPTDGLGLPQTGPT